MAHNFDFYRDAAALKFDSSATKLGDVADRFRREAYIRSATLSACHQFCNHDEPDLEVVFRQLLLRQTQADFDLMMATINKRKPACSRCRQAAPPLNPRSSF